MFIWTTRLKRKNLVIGAAVLLVVLCGALMLGGLRLFSGDRAVNAAANPKGIKTNEDRVKYLESYGWLVQDEPLEVEELLIPEEFDASYDDYLALQSEQGFDLTKYAGQRVKRYSYLVLNYPTGEKGVQAGLLIYKNTVIGGEVLSAQLDGFLHGLPMPK